MRLRVCAIGRLGEVLVAIQLKDKIKVRFSEGELEYHKDTTDPRHSYCCTVWKYQGSETDAVVGYFQNFLMSRELLYTAVTRAKKAVTLVLPIDALRTGLATCWKDQRVTRLAMRLKEAWPSRKRAEHTVSDAETEVCVKKARVDSDSE